MTNKFIPKILIIAIVCLSLFTLARPVLAVDIFLFSARQELSSDELVVSLGLDTGSDRINTVSGELSYDKNILEFVSISNANSIIPLWLEVSSNKNLGIVSFSGVVPGGFGGQGKIISLIFKSNVADKDVENFVKVKKIEILRNDGSGTIISTKIITPSANIINSLDFAPVGDTNAPELFKPVLSQNDPLLGNQSYLIFNTTDKGSGVDKYFVSETKSRLNIRDNKSVSEALWQEAKSPYLLEDQTLSSYVYVKVVDRANNVLVVALEQEKEFYQTWWFWIFIVILIFFIVACGKLYKKRY